MERPEYVQLKVALSKAYCIGPNCRPISDFCDHKNPVFTLFPEYFDFLPECYQDVEELKWLEFFRHFDLRSSISKETFIDFCTWIAAGVVNTKASNILLEHLSSNVTWHDDTEFILMIGRIPFVCICSLDAVIWISEPYSTLPTGSMTTLCGAAVEEHTPLLWTLRPIVKLPELLCQLCSSLQMTVIPSVMDVITNIKNISNSVFSDQNLFLNFPDELITPPQCSTLIDVMFENFKYLKQNMEVTSSCQLQLLADIPCIPVYANPMHKEKERIVLVKPSQVIHASSCEFSFYPYVHILPEEISDVFSVLQVTGVRNQIELCHISQILQNIKETQEHNSDVETIITNAIKHLHRFLCTNEGEIKLQSLCELYLPNAEGLLVDSTKLMLSDIPLQSLEFSSYGKTLLFKLPSNCGLTETDLCKLLPAHLAPKPMSVYCKQKPLPEGIDQFSVVAKEFRASLCSSNFRTALCLIVKKISDYDEVCKEIHDSLKRFQNTVKVVGVCNVSVEFSYNNEMVASVSSLLHMDNMSYNVYIESDISPPLLDMAYSTFADQLMAFLLKNISATSLNFEGLTSAIPVLLKCNNWKEMEKCLNFLGIRSIETQFITPGANVPESSIDFDISSALNEWVAYNREDGTMVFVQLVGEMPDMASCNIGTAKYRILLNETEKIVNRLHLYNIQQVAPHDERSTEEIKESISNLLKCFWSLGKDDRETLLKRLYFTWLHQNQSIVEFLRQQIVILLPETEVNNEMDEISCLVASNTSSLAPRAPSYSCNVQCPRAIQSNKSVHKPVLAPNIIPSTSPSTSKEPLGRWNVIGDHCDVTGKELLDRWDVTVQSAVGWNNCCVLPDISSLPNYKEGMRWLEQAESDLKALQLLNHCSIKFSDYEDICGHVCFLAQQVAEKALKGGRYALCGMSNDQMMTHRLSSHALAIQNVRPEICSDLTQLSDSLEQYYLNTRYPNRHTYPKVPKNVYRRSDSSKAYEIAERILKIIKQLVLRV